MDENSERIRKVKALISKDEKAASNAAREMIDNADNEMFSALVEKTPYLFDFVRTNVCRRIENAVTNHNFKNIFKFFNTESDYDDLFAKILKRYATEELTDEIFELLCKGTDIEKVYAAAYFVYIPDTIASDELRKHIFSDNEHLARACACALSESEDKQSFNEALARLKSSDDFESFGAFEFFVNYGKNPPLKDIFDMFEKSILKEHIAAQIPYILPLDEGLTQFKDETLNIIEKFIDGLGEVIPLCEVVSSNLYEIFNILSKDFLNEARAKIILLKSEFKFKEFSQNEAYTFDEDKQTSNEILKIGQFFTEQNFSQKLLSGLKEILLSKDRKLVISTLEIISEYKSKIYEDEISEIINNSTDAEVVYYAVVTARELGILKNEEKNAVSEKITDLNLKKAVMAVFESL